MFKRDDGGALTGLDILALFVFFALALTLIPDTLGMADKPSGEGPITLQFVLVGALIGLAIFRTVSKLFAKPRE